MLSPQDDKFKKFIDKLSQDSWQLELIVSGFSIFGLNSLGNHLNEIQNRFLYLYTSHTALMLINSLTAFVGIVLFGLVIHVFIRGLWIAMLGLNFMGGEYDHDYLNYQPKFSNFLKKNLKPLNHYIYQLELYASSIFGLTFLFAFQMAFFFLNLFLIMLITDSFFNFKTEFSKIIGVILLLSLITIIIINFIDFILIGWFKKNRWTAKVYYPIYRLYSWMSFSFLYRPILYKLIDNKAGKRIIIISLIGFSILFMFSEINYRPFYFMNSTELKFEFKSEVITNKNLYLDKLNEKDYIEKIVINKEVIEEKSISVFFRHLESHEDSLRVHFPKLKIKDFKSRGLQAKSGLNVTFGQKKESRKPINLYMSSFNKMFYVQIDSTKYPADFILKQMPNEQLVYFTSLPTKNLTEGKHFLYMMYQNKKQIDTLGIVPFWYYP